MSATTILVSFILVVGQPDGMTVPEARKASTIAIEKLNTLSPLRFKSLGVTRMRDPFVGESDGYRRLAFWNKKFAKNKGAANYVHVFDRTKVEGLSGIAYECQPSTKRGQFSLTFNPASEDGTSLVVYNGIVAAHEIAHQVGFQHVTAYLKSLISIMSFDLWWYRFTRHASKFFFYDGVDALPEFGCKVNFRGKI